MEGGTVFHFVTLGPNDALERAIEAAEGKDVQIGGGVSHHPCAHRCRNAYCANKASVSQDVGIAHCPENRQSRMISMAESKTKPTNASVDDYIASRANAQQQADCRELMALFKRVTRQTPRMWGPSIVGYGSYRYAYESGRTGEAPLACFAIRGRELVVYLWPEGQEQKSLLSRLGKHKIGKSCLYFKQLADLDQSVLEKLVVGSIAEAKRRYS
jgi:hypothetical protein